MVEGEMTNKDLLDFINRFWPQNKNPGFGVRTDNIIVASMSAQLILELRRTNELLKTFVARLEE